MYLLDLPNYMADRIMTSALLKRAVSSLKAVERVVQGQQRGEDCGRAGRPTLP